jgi:hypothetical protein
MVSCSLSAGTTIESRGAGGSAGGESEAERGSGACEPDEREAGISEADTVKPHEYSA